MCTGTGIRYAKLVFVRASNAILASTIIVLKLVCLLQFNTYHYLSLAYGYQCRMTTVILMNYCAAAVFEGNHKFKVPVVIKGESLVLIGFLNLSVLYSRVILSVILQKFGVV